MKNWVFVYAWEFITFHREWAKFKPANDTLNESIKSDPVKKKLPIHIVPRVTESPGNLFSVQLSYTWVTLLWVVGTFLQDPVRLEWAFTQFHIQLIGYDVLEL